MDIKSVKVDSARGERGDWIGNIPGMGDLRLHVRSFSNSDYQGFLAKEFSAVPREQRIGGRTDAPLMPNVRDAIITRGMVEHVLLGWENLTEGGNTVEFSKEASMNYLSDPDYRVFNEAVTWAATMVEKIREDEVQSATGNS